MTARLSKPTALRAAAALRRTPSDQVVLAHRPGRHITHVYVGPLTRSGRFLPRSARPLCGTRCRRLTVAAVGGEARALCRSCSACLTYSTTPAVVGQAGHTPVSREDWVDEFTSLTLFDLAVDAFLAETEAEANRVRFLGMTLHGWDTYLRTEVTSPGGKTSGPLAKHVGRALSRVGATTNPTYTTAMAESAAAAAQRRREEVGDLWHAREGRIARFGMTAVAPRRTRTTT